MEASPSPVYGARLLSGFGATTPSRVQIPPPPPTSLASPGRPECIYLSHCEMLQCRYSQSADHGDQWVRLPDNEGESRTVLSRQEDEQHELRTSHRRRGPDRGPVHGGHRTHRRSSRGLQGHHLAGREATRRRRCWPTPRGRPSQTRRGRDSALDLRLGHHLADRRADQAQALSPVCAMSPRSAGRGNIASGDASSAHLVAELEPRLDLELLLELRDVAGVGARADPERLAPTGSACPPISIRIVIARCSASMARTSDVSRLVKGLRPLPGALEDVDEIGHQRRFAYGERHRLTRRAPPGHDRDPPVDHDQPVEELVEGAHLRALGGDRGDVLVAWPTCAGRSAGRACAS